MRKVSSMLWRSGSSMKSLMVTMALDLTLPSMLLLPEKIWVLSSPATRYTPDMLVRRKADVEARLVNRMDTTSFEDRVYRLSDPMIRELYDEARDAVHQKIAAYDARR